MTLNSLVSKLFRYLSWLYYGRGWTAWELLTIAIITLVLILLILRRQQKTRTRRMMANQTEEQPPIIGAKLAESKGTNLVMKDSEKLLAFASEKEGKQKHWRQTTEKWKQFKEKIEQLRREITKYKRAEELLKRQLAKLTAANEKLHHEIAEFRKAEEQPKQQAIVSDAADEPFQSETNEHQHIEQMPRESTEKAKRQRHLSGGPMDAEQLKAIAKFAKQLRGRYRHISEQSPGPVISGKGDSA